MGPRFWEDIMRQQARERDRAMQWRNEMMPRGFSPTATMINADFDTPSISKVVQQQEGEKAFKELKDSAVAIVPKKVEPKNGSKKLAELGLTKLASDAKKIEDKAIKESMIGLAGYTRIPKAKVDELNTRLRKVRKELALTSVESYSNGVPPGDVLEKLSDAKKAKLFDSFAIFSIVEVKDPVLVGRITESEDYFFIAEWGDDVSLKDFIG